MYVCMYVHGSMQYVGSVQAMIVFLLFFCCCCPVHTSFNCSTTVGPDICFVVVIVFVCL